MPLSQLWEWEPKRQIISSIIAKIVFTHRLPEMVFWGTPGVPGILWELLAKIISKDFVLCRKQRVWTQWSLSISILLVINSGWDTSPRGHDKLGTALRVTIAQVAGDIRNRVADVCKTHHQRVIFRGLGTIFLSGEDSWVLKEAQHREEGTNWGGTLSYREFAWDRKQYAEPREVPDGPLERSSSALLFRLSTRTGAPFSKETIMNT